MEHKIVTCDIRIVVIMVLLEDNGEAYHGQDFQEEWLPVSHPEETLQMCGHCCTWCPSLVFTSSVSAQSSYFHPAVLHLHMSFAHWRHLKSERSFTSLPLPNFSHSYLTIIRHPFSFFAQNSFNLSVHFHHGSTSHNTYMWKCLRILPACWQW